MWVEEDKVEKAFTLLLPATLIFRETGGGVTSGIFSVNIPFVRI